MLSFLRPRPLALCGLGAVAGVLAEPPAWGALLALLVLGLAAATRGIPRLSAAALPLLLLAASFTCGLASARLQSLARERDRRALAMARCRSPPPLATYRLLVERAGEDPFAGRAWLSGRTAEGLGVFCSWPGSASDRLGRGATVLVSGRVGVPSLPGNPGQRDPGEALVGGGASLRLDLRAAENGRLLEPAPEGPRLWLERLRRRAARRLQATLPGDLGGIACALLLGLRGGIPDADRRLFERTGTLHLLAISGMHVVLLAACAAWLLRRAGLGPRTTALATFCLASVYLPLAGGDPPIRRAVLGLAFHTLSLLRGRPADAATALGGAAAVIALLDPADVLTAGFRLSFLATAGISLLAGVLEERWGRRHRFLARFPAVQQDRPVRLRLNRYLLKAVPVSLAATLFTLPSVAFDFGRVSPLSVATNLIAVPLASLALPLLPLLAAGAELLAAPTVLLLSLLRTVLTGADRLPFVNLAVAPPSLLVFLLWSLGSLALRRGTPGSLPCFAAALLAWPSPESPREPSLLLLDVGHGQAALLRMPDGRAALLDAGSRTHRDAGRRVLLPTLRSEGVLRLDLVVCSHADADHWNALPELFAALPVGRLVVGPDPAHDLLEAARARGIRIDSAQPGETLLAGEEIVLRVLGAPDDPGATRNDRSLPMLLTVRGRTVLLPADREEAGLRALIAAGIPRVDLLVAPHHGAACREARALGEAARPGALLVSASASFPDGATLHAYGAARTFFTATRGALRVRFPADRLPHLEPFR
ncbi:MAG: ComEC/Rec2 family competence protein [Planctomycetaceae bacterium]